MSRRAALLLPLALPARAADAAEQVAALLAALDALSAQASLPDAEVAARFDALAARHFDRAAMLLAALGNVRRGIADADWARLQAAFGAHLAHGFVLGVRRQGASASRVLGSRPLPGGGTLVAARIRVGGRERDAQFFACAADPARICDIEADGVRASARHRAAFAPLLDAEGLEALIAALGSGRLAALD